MKESGWLSGQNQYVARLKKMPLFAPFNEEDLAAFLQICKIRVYQPQEAIVTEGEKERSMYFLLSGYVQVIKGGKTIAKLESVGEIFGEMGFLDGQARSASVIAVDETTCLMVDAACLDLLSAKSEEGCIGAKIYHTVALILSVRLRETTGLLVAARQEAEQLRRGISRQASVSAAIKH